MIDPGLLREHSDQVRSGLSNRGLDLTSELEELATLETRRRRLLVEIEGLKREQNAAADEVARARRQGQDAKAIQDASRQRAGHIKQLEVEHPDRDIAVVIPDLIMSHWYEGLLHNNRGEFLRMILRAQCSDRVVVINTPFHLRD